MPPLPEDPEDPDEPVERPAGASGSIDVEMSGAMPAAASGSVAVPIEPEPTSKRKRAATAVGEGVSMVGEGVSKLGEGVSKLGGATSKVPLVGSSISKLGDGMQAVGGSLHDLGATKTRGGRLLVRSMIVGFLLVASWIVVIVMLQLRSTETVDFRPAAVEILTQLSNRNFEQVYDNASPRFQEMARKERFVDDMADLRLTVGAFREIAAINDTLVTTGPTGRIGRVSMTLVYAQATCKASVSFHYDEDVEKWRLLGLGVELPPELQISQRQREERIAACKDPMNPRSCDVHAAAVAVFEQLRDEHAGEVWDDATPIFQKQEERARFISLQAEHRARLGKFRRIIAVSEARVYGGISATFDILVEYERSSGVRAVLGFARDTRTAPWKLRSYKVVVPMPRAADVAMEKLGLGAGSAGPVKPPVPVLKPAAGSGSATKKR